MKEWTTPRTVQRHFPTQWLLSAAFFVAYNTQTLVLLGRLLSQWQPQTKSEEQQGAPLVALILLARYSTSFSFINFHKGKERRSFFPPWMTGTVAGRIIALFPAIHSVRRQMVHYKQISYRGRLFHSLTHLKTRFLFANTNLRRVSACHQLIPFA